VDLLPYLLMFVAFAAVVRTLAQLEQLAALLVLSSAPVSGMALLQALINRPDWALPKIVDYEIRLGIDEFGRARSLFNNANEAGIYLAMLLPLMVYFAIGLDASEFSAKRRRLMRWLSCLLIIASVAGIFLTGSRNAMAVVLAVGLILALTFRRLGIAAALVLAALVLAWGVWGPVLGIGGEWLRVIISPSIVERLLSLFNASGPGFNAITERFQAWNIDLQAIEMRPLQGWGLKTYQSVAERLGLDHQNLPHEHNVFLMLALGTGIPGLLGFLALQIATIRAALQARLPAHGRQLVAACLAGGLVFILSGFFDIFFYEPRVHLLGWLLLGIAYGVSQGPPSWWSRTDPRHGTISP
jgi:O-antigen ligase